MKLSLKYIGRTILNLVVESNNTTLEEDITNLHYYVDEDFITSLREIADNLEEHNNKQRNKDK